MSTTSLPVRRHIAAAAALSAALAVGITATAPLDTAEAQPATATNAAAAASWPTVKSGQRGTDVKTVQLLLIHRGYSLKADGVFGSGTAAKVKSFQKAKGLRADGIVGANTWSKLILTVKTGSKGNAVKALQLQLTDNGYATNADGAFGTRTAEKVRAFQKAKGLKADGIAGPNTWAALVRGGGSSGGGSGPVTLKFDKGTVTNSKLYVLKGGKVIASYRAGSGTMTNECTTAKGWLPTATYSIGGHWRNYNGSLVKGYAIRLADKRCNNGKGTLRTELFIHSEMTSSGGQGSTEARRWDGVNDYKSNGCIKLHPNDIKSLFKVLDKNGWPKSLTVVN
ncbi:peptidoglycan-binding protein [Streptomyces ipomoeae]|uniref:Peptidoglycan-binding protein n=1 Tax=Streptomyces ipomoeae TaxID=103232 RepID=A0AAE8VVP7_9ACTN|nr:peptidoglycan-binding protein [Streptomyces ipomoeae]TQE21986.1 peptidoglycan-binding protein [Streptomyces ipomoeae]